MNKFIKYDDRYYYLIMDLLYIALITLLLIIGLIQFFDISIIIICIFMISILFVALVSVIKLGIKFNYKKEIITVFTPGFYNCGKIKMIDVKTIAIEEIHKTRKKRFHFFNYYRNVGIIYEPKNIYRNGKIYNIIIQTKDNSRHIIFYGMLYKARSKKRILKQEEKIKAIINEFNDYKYNKYFKKNKL